MATSKVITFRPQIDILEDYEALEEWCTKNKTTINSILNSFLPAIAFAVMRRQFKDDIGRRFARCDFGDILLREPNYVPKAKRK